MFDQAQLRKGTLEGCILKIIDREPTYGYAIATTLRDSGFADLTEGTLYPLLLRLERKGLIAAEYRARGEKLLAHALPLADECYAEIVKLIDG